MDSEKEGVKRQKNPRESANFLSALTYFWTIKIFLKGSKKELEEADLYRPLVEHTSNKLGNEIEKYWIEEELRAKKQSRDPSFLKVFIKLYWSKAVFFGVLLGFNEIFLKVAQPLFLGSLLRYFSPGSTITKEEAFISAACVIGCSALSVFISNPVMMGITHTGMKIRVACCSLIYRKALRLSKTALGQTTAGQVVNLLSNDVNRFDLIMLFINYIWLGPMQTCFVLYFLWEQIGVASIIGVATLLVFIPLQGWLGKKSSQLRLKTALRTDERVRLMNEIISGIQVIKMYTWEKPFAKLVSKARKDEIKEIRVLSYIRGTMLSFVIFHSRLAIFCSIFAYILFDNIITAEKVFVVTSFFNVLRQTMTLILPGSIAQLSEALVSIKRLQKFLTYEEATLILQDKGSVVDKKNGKLSEEMVPMITNYQIQPIVKDKSIDIRKASAKWLPESNENTLNNINLRIEPGKLTAIIGTVGSGKTSLLHAILRELPLSQGSISVGGVVSYASQEPWLFAGSVRQNILFGLDYDKDRYKQVVKVCALRADFEQFPYGDKTIVGERGISMSGGQRARINLARAVYKQADIYLLDDPLSAVDTHVGKHLFDDCITGFLKNKTCILITHQLQYLTAVSHIVFMENGKIQAEGNYHQVKLRARNFTRLISNEQGDKEVELNLNNKTESLLPSLVRTSFQSIPSLYEEPIMEEPEVIQEVRSHGSVGSKMYIQYFLAGGNCCMLLFLIGLVVLSQLLASSGDYWITFWVNREEYYQNMSALITEQPLMNLSTLVTASSVNFSLPTLPMSTTDSALPTLSTVFNELTGPVVYSRDFYLYVFSALTLATIFVTLFRSYLFFNLCSRASMRLHDRMFDSITRATMRFFNTNPSGQILNRFSKDIGSIDDFLPGALIDTLQIGLTIVGVLVVVSVVNIWLMVPTLIVVVPCYFLRRFYISTSRSMKRLEGVTRSPVFSHLNASIQGLTTIRAFQVQSVLEKEFDIHQDLHSSAFYIFIATSRAFGFWLDLISLFFIGFITFSFLVFDLGNTFGGSVGLSITQCIGLTGMMQWGMRQSAELENQMTSVERVLEYTDLDKEPPLESQPDKKPPDTWPTNGRITFSNVFMAYSPDGLPVLKNLSFVVEPKEKVGIVGRTGAGKSSLITALFHMADIQGDIVIDGINITKIGLHDLRSKISIIPQEPVLFSGTLRKNLDPFDMYSDDVLWSALEEVELKAIVKEMPEGLNSKMSEGGSNFSVGQRQLVCLARAIVRNNRILVLDEATANVDPQTDALIQSTIRRKFADCTVLTIAHRLHTVMDSDKILVMGNGTVVEYNHPHLLLQNTSSTLFSMVEQTGKIAAGKLHKVAELNYQQKMLNKNKTTIKK